MPVNFGSNINGKEAAELVSQACTLRAERRKSGLERLAKLGESGIIALAKKAETDFTTLCELDDILSDVSGGPGGFFNCNWKASDYLTAFQKYIEV